MTMLRPSWQHDLPLWGPHIEPIAQLMSIESIAREQVERSLNALPPDLQTSIDAIRPIIETANVDLTIGCDVARGGHLKQAFSLWRAWFEQSLFALYFLEAPLHRRAWRTVDAVGAGKRPAFSLMLHQILVSDGDRADPFGLVYKERCDNLLAALRISLKKDLHPLRVATHRLTDLSQGVHGTFRPARVAAETDLGPALNKHALPVLRSTVRVVGFLWFVCVQSSLDLSAEQVIGMRSASFTPDASKTEETAVHPVLPQLRDWLQEVGGELDG
jgi:hypothetical protein